MHDFTNLGHFTYSGDVTLNTKGEFVPDPTKVTYVPPGRVTLLKAVRDLLEYNPERHDQRTWAGNEFGSVIEAPLGDIAKLAKKALPEEPEDSEAPVCGTTGCTAGWAVFLGDDPRIVLLNSSGLLRLPSGDTSDIRDHAVSLLKLTVDQSDWLFSEERDRDEIIAALDRLIEDEHAEIWHEPQAELTIKVFDEHGNLVHEVTESVDNGEDVSERDAIEAALYQAYREI